ncbi:hypothetical protein QOZ80_1BG0065220 [Eleusine coracana subsp. coracana]|nr:hypothetical protein QOZ80_1BG0065220 [Eleusine coracana subsp. coracana]
MLSSILVIGGTGKIGQHLVMASLDAGHPTAVLLRPSSVDDPGKARLVEDFKTRGAIIVYGDINNHEGLVRAIKQADVVISAVGHTSPEEVESQLKIVAGMQEAGNVRRYVPSEYGCDVEHADQMLEPARSILGAKCRVREALKMAGIPYTIISSNWIQGFLLPRAGDPEANAPPETRVTIPGDGTTQVFFVNEKDLSVVVIKAIEDPRTLNKILHVRPQENLCSLERLVSLWETKLGKILEKSYVSEEEIVKKIQESRFPLNFQLAVVHWTLVATKPKVHEEVTGALAGDEVEATELYPELKYITVEEFLGSLP